ncbi:MAG: prepilin-type N-terminal cleavage/methylation domain-containing protein [Planctomycetaceae bacterium]
MGRVTQPSTLDPRPSTLHSRRAFTLLEVLVALGLSVVLMAAVYGAINLSFQLSTAGREKMEQAQLVRAIFQQFDADVRSVVFALQESIASDTEGAAAEEDAQAEEEVETMTTDEAFANASSGVYGDAQTLVVHVSRPSRNAPAVSPPAAVESAGRSDLAAVSYFLAVRGASGLPGTVADMAYQGTLLNAPRRGTVTGLTRLEGDRLSVQFAEETGDVQTLAAAAQILAPEVVSLSFAYWDGAEWTESWDTVTDGRLPSAIEITLGVDTSQRDARGIETRSLRERVSSTPREQPAEPTYYRHVVALPLAEPYVGELSE